MVSRNVLDRAGFGMFFLDLLKNRIQAIVVNICDFVPSISYQETFWCINCLVMPLEVSIATMFSKSALIKFVDGIVNA